MKKAVFILGFFIVSISFVNAQKTIETSDSKVVSDDKVVVTDVDTTKVDSTIKTSEKQKEKDKCKDKDKEKEKMKSEAKKEE